MNERHVPQFQTRGPSPGEVSTTEAAIWRMRVKETPYEENDVLARCRIINGDGTVEGQRDYIVRLTSGHVVGEELFVLAPLGGSDQKLEGEEGAEDDEPLIPLEELKTLPVGTGQYKVLLLMDTRSPGTPVWDWPRFSA